MLSDCIFEPNTINSSHFGGYLLGNWYLYHGWDATPAARSASQVLDAGTVIWFVNSKVQVQGQGYLFVEKALDKARKQYSTYIVSKNYLIENTSNKKNISHVPMAVSFRSFVFKEIQSWKWARISSYDYDVTGVLTQISAAVWSCEHGTL